MTSSQTTGQPSSGKVLYACSTFGDLLGCLARLRVTVEPLPGLGHLGGRPVVSEGISASDARRLSGPADYEFPVLVEIPADTRCDDGWLAQSVPLSITGTLVFRSEAERARIVNTLLDDVPVDELSTRVQPELFGRAAATLPMDAPRRGQPAPRTWIADAVGGAMCGLLLAVSRRADCAKVLEEGFPGPWRHWPGAIEVLRQVESGAPPEREQQSLALAAFIGALRLSGKPGLDPDEVLDLFSGIVAEWHVHADVEAVEAWSRYVREITSCQRALSAAEVRDPVDEKGNLVLRALLLSLFREQIHHVLEDSADGELPGARVTVTAAMLVGMRTGLHRCSRKLKQPFAATLGSLAAAVDSIGEAGGPLKNFMPTARYGGRGRVRVLRVADGADRTLAEHPAPEETLLDRIGRILTAGGLAVSTADRQCTVSEGGETVWLTTSLPPPVQPPKTSRRARGKAKKAEPVAGVAENETPIGAGQGAGGEARPADIVAAPLQKKKRARRAKSTTARDGMGKASEASATPLSAADGDREEPNQTTDWLSEEPPKPDK